MDNIAHFDPFHYAKSLKDMIAGEFPSLQTVAWLSQPTETQFTDLAVPAFLMSFGNPEPLTNLARNHFDDEGAYSFNMELNMMGELILPVIPQANINVDDDSNVALVAVTATHNLCAFIYAKSGGLGAGVPTIKTIDYNWSDADDPQIDEQYITASIAWSHDCFVGYTPGGSFVIPKTLYNRFTFAGGQPPDEYHEVYPDRGQPEP